MYCGGTMVNPRACTPGLDVARSAVLLASVTLVLLGILSLAFREPRKGTVLSRTVLLCAWILPYAAFYLVLQLTVG